MEGFPNIAPEEETMTSVVEGFRLTKSNNPGGMKLRVVDERAYPRERQLLYVVCNQALDQDDVDLDEGTVFLRSCRNLNTLCYHNKVVVLFETHVDDREDTLYVIVVNRNLHTTQRFEFQLEQGRYYVDFRSFNNRLLIFKKIPSSFKDYKITELNFHNLVMRKLMPSEKFLLNLSEFFCSSQTLSDDGKDFNIRSWRVGNNLVREFKTILALDRDYHEVDVDDEATSDKDHSVEVAIQ